MSQVKSWIKTDTKPILIYNHSILHYTCTCNYKYLINSCNNDLTMLICREEKLVQSSDDDSEYLILYPFVPMNDVKKESVKICFLK